MPKVTKIVKQQRRDDWCSIFIDAKYAFSLPISAVVDNKLRIGLELNQSEVERLKKHSDWNKLYDSALRKLLRRHHSEREIRDFLRQKKASEEDIESIVEKLSAKNYLNDVRFAEWWVRERRELKNRSSRQLNSELAKKGVDRLIIDSVLAEESEDANKQALRAMVAKKSRLSRYKDPTKLIAYLQRQGFNYSDIKSAITEAEED